MNRILEEDALTIAQTPINWQKFHNKTILIAGANGYVPQHFVHLSLIHILRMPHMTGYEATKAIRELNRSDALSVPIIAMSADAFSDDIQRCHECGMNAHIAKPIDIMEVSRLLKRFLIKK